MENNIYSVTQVNNYIKLLFDDDILLNNISLEGEISNFKEHTSGHLYFSIKDSNASINSVMFKNCALGLNIKLKNGMKVVCYGSVSSYVKTGQYQFYAHKIKPIGEGDLFAKFEMLKQELLAKGIFDNSHKKEIPELPKTIGVITSPTSAALRDILNVSKRRNSGVKIIVIPSLVQGDDAPNDIIKAINIANEYGKIDTLILARGGGSKEDIWAFNDENVAYAIFNSKIPIVTGIGHEIDFTIADFVGDFRAPTPSSAIEVALPEIKSVRDNLQSSVLTINREIDKKLYLTKNDFKSILLQDGFNLFPRKVSEYKNQSISTLTSIDKDFDNKIVKNKLILNNKIEKVELLSPLNILKNGYSLVTDEEDNPIKSTQNLNIGDEINISFSDGVAIAQVKHIE